LIRSSDNLFPSSIDFSIRNIKKRIQVSMGNCPLAGR